MKSAASILGALALLSVFGPGVALADPPGDPTAVTQDIGQLMFLNPEPIGPGWFSLRDD